MPKRFCCVISMDGAKIWCPGWLFGGEWVALTKLKDFYKVRLLTYVSAMGVGQDHKGVVVTREEALHRYQQANKG